MKKIMMPTVRTEQLGDVLLIEINNPPINAGSLTVRQGLAAAPQFCHEPSGLPLMTREPLRAS